MDGRPMFTIEEATAALKAVLQGSTREMGRDSTDQPYAHIRVASLDKVRELLNRKEA